MTWIGVLAAATLLLVPFTSTMAASADTTRLSVVSVDASRAGHLSALLRLPAGATPKPADFHLVLDADTSVPARELHEQRLRTMFLIDVSGSMKGAPLEDVKASVRAFLPTTRSQDQFALTTFADESRPVADFAVPRDALDRALHGLKIEGSKTKLYRILDDVMTAGVKPAANIRHIFVVITDGDDVGSGVSFEKVRTASKATGVPIYALFRGKVSEKSLRLPELASETGGRFYLTGDRKELASALDEIYRLEANVVSVSFSYPPDNNGRTTDHAAIELRQLDRTALRANVSERIALRTGITPPDTTPPNDGWHWLWWLVPAILLGGAVLWRALGGRKRPEPVPDASALDGSEGRQRPPDAGVQHEPVSPPRHSTVLIGRYFPVPSSGHPTAILRGVAGPVSDREYAVDKDLFSIGARPQCDLPISDDEYVSSDHAYLRYESGSLFIVDKASRNGTFVNEMKVPATGLVLSPGDHIKLGICEFEVDAPSS